METIYIGSVYYCRQTEEEIKKRARRVESLGPRPISNQLLQFYLPKTLFELIEDNSELKKKARTALWSQLNSADSFEEVVKNMENIVIEMLLDYEKENPGYAGETYRKKHGL